MPECGCCDKGSDLAGRRPTRFGFAIEEVDIDNDPDLTAKFNTEVPVVAVNGKVRFRGVVNPALLERLLVAESRNRPDGCGIAPGRHVMRRSKRRPDVADDAAFFVTSPRWLGRGRPQAG